MSIAQGVSPGRYKTRVINPLSLWERVRVRIRVRIRVRVRVREDLQGINTFMIFSNQVNNYPKKPRTSSTEKTKRAH